jgi:hypothetical protein
LSAGLVGEVAGKGRGCRKGQQLQERATSMMMITISQSNATVSFGWCRLEAVGLQETTTVAGKGNSRSK